MKIQNLKKLITIASELDQKGLSKEADALDSIIQKMADRYDDDEDRWEYNKDADREMETPDDSGSGVPLWMSKDLSSPQRHLGELDKTDEELGFVDPDYPEFKAPKTLDERLAPINERLSRSLASVNKALEAKLSRLKDSYNILLSEYNFSDEEGMSLSTLPLFIEEKKDLFNEARVDEERNSKQNDFAELVFRKLDDDLELDKLKTTAETLIHFLNSGGRITEDPSDFAYELGEANAEFLDSTEPVEKFYGELEEEVSEFLGERGIEGLEGLIEEYERLRKILRATSLVPAIVEDTIAGLIMEFQDLARSDLDLEFYADKEKENETSLYLQNKDKEEEQAQSDFEKSVLPAGIDIENTQNPENYNLSNKEERSERKIVRPLSRWI